MVKRKRKRSKSVTAPVVKAIKSGSSDLALSLLKNLDKYVRGIEKIITG